MIVFPAIHSQESLITENTRVYKRDLSMKIKTCMMSLQKINYLCNCFQSVKISKVSSSPKYNNKGCSFPSWFQEDLFCFTSVQFSSVTKSYPALCNPMNRSTPGLPVHHQLPESTQTHVHRVSDAIQPSHPLSPSSPPALNLSQHQGLFK